MPPQGKGSLYVRPLLIGSGPILGLGPSPEYMLLVYASPVGNYFKVSFSVFNLLMGFKSSAYADTLFIMNACLQPLDDHPMVNVYIDTVQNYYVTLFGTV